MNNDHLPTPPDPCALDLGQDDAPHQQADARVVHGLLRMLDEGESARVVARVDRATAAVRAQEGGLRLVGTRAHRFRERLAWIGGSAGMAAAIVLALLFFPSSTEATAVAALNSMRSTARAGGRCYEILIQPHRPPSAGPERGRADGPERGRGDRPDRARAEGFRRIGELQLGAEGRWTLTMSKLRRESADRPPTGDRPVLERIVMGFDGTQYWLVGPRGSIRRSDSQITFGKGFPGAVEVGILDGPELDTEGEQIAMSGSGESLGYMTLSSVLDSLQRGYQVSFDSRTDADTSLGRPITVVQARRLDSRGGEGPQSVRLVADSTTLEVISVRLTWAIRPSDGAPASAQPAGGMLPPRAVLIRQLPIGACESIGPKWFLPEFHSSRGDDFNQLSR